MMIKRYEKLFELCHSIAVDAHGGQFRRDKKTPYIVHPEQVADLFDSYLDKCIAIMHDVIEDCADKGYTLIYIRERLFKFDVDCELDNEITYIINGICTLTHRDEVAYFPYVKNIKALGYEKFKIADIAVNLADDPTDKQKKKYKKAMKILIT